MHTTRTMLVTVLVIAAGVTGYLVQRQNTPATVPVQQPPKPKADEPKADGPKVPAPEATQPATGPAPAPIRHWVAARAKAGSAVHAARKPAVTAELVRDAEADTDFQAIIDPRITIEQRAAHARKELGERGLIDVRSNNDK